MKIKEYIPITNDIVISDGNYMSIENFKSLSECSDILIGVRAKNYMINIWGNGLRVEFYSSNNIFIFGNFEKIEFLKAVR
ncbi:MAG: YabP/YqfC family sporulation protein [Ruminococcus sp.]|nr:YabP/YqfC family sporulation protein [Ruminococcus sp.]